MWWLLVACADPEPAPRDLDALLHALWAAYGAGGSDDLASATRELAALVDAAALPLDGTVTDLTVDEIASAGLVGPDPAPARGMYSLGLVDCTPAEVARILASDEQMSLYPDNYTFYDRTYTSSQADFESGEADRLDWDTEYGVQIPVLATYSAFVNGGMRRAEDGADGPYLYSRTSMPEAAEAEQDNVDFTVDYQLEIFYPHGEGMLHAFGMWRYIRFGELDTDDDGTVALILDGLHDWDDATTSICAEGRI